MHVYCIDGENTSNKWGHLLKLVEPHDKILLFFSKACKHMSIPFLYAIQSTQADLEFISCHTGANAMDFQLCTELGCRIADDRTAKYVIVSEDKGYDAVVRYWSEKGVSVSRLPIRSGSPNYTPPPSNSYQRKKKPVGKTGKLTHAKMGKPVDKQPKEEPAPPKEIVYLPEFKCRTEWRVELLKRHIPKTRTTAIIDVMLPALRGDVKNPKLSVYNGLMKSFGKSVGTNLYRTIEPVVSKIMTEGPLPESADPAKTE